MKLPCTFTLLVIALRTRYVRLVLLCFAGISPPVTAKMLVEKFEIQSSILAENKINLATKRSIYVILPPDYYASNRPYPVVYYVHNAFWDNHRIINDNQVDKILSRVFKRHRDKAFIFVAADFTTPSGGNFFGNNTISGRWFDYLAEEIIAEVDKRYRTIAKPLSRGVSGDMLGGYAALKFPMQHPGVVSSVYALHPVGTASGDRVPRFVPDWQQMNQAQQWSELQGFSQIFMMMAQAHAPNPDKPPFYADLMVELSDGKPLVNAETSYRLKQNFSLINWVPKHVKSLRDLNGLMLDWGRYDSNQDHVIANRRFAITLEDYGIEHEAEEYRGGAWDKIWVRYGRLEERMIPFFMRHLSYQ